MVEYSELFKYNPVPTWVYEKKSLQIVDVNESALKNYGYSKDEFLSKTMLDLSPKDEVSHIKQVQKLILNHEGIINIGVFTHLKSNGERIRTDIDVHKVNFKNKECVIAVSQDITFKEQVFQKNLETRNLIDASLDVIASIDIAGNFIEVSAASKSLWGYSPEELAGTPYMDLVHPEDLEITEQAAAETMSGKNLTTFENRYIKKNGKIAFNLWSSRWDEELMTMYVTARDATEKKEKEQLLIESESRFKALVQEGSDLIAILDEKSIYKYVSPTSTNILGITPEELVGQSPFEFIHPDDKEKVMRSLSAITTQKRVRVEPFRFQNKEGEWRWIESVFTNLINDPSVKGIVANSRDITSLKTEEHRLKLLESVVMNTRDSVIITEAEPQQEPGPKILFVNPAFTEMTGYTSEEVIGKSPRFLQGPKSDKEELKKLGDLMKRWEPYEVTTVNYKKNGEEFWLNFRINPVADENGWFTHWISIEKDVTEQKNDEIQRELLSLISEEFKVGNNLHESIQGVCNLIVNFENFSFCEIWLPTISNNKLRLYSKRAYDKEAKLFYETANFLSELSLGEGLPGKVWEKGKTEIWENIANDNSFVRKDAAKKSGINAVMGLPLLHKNKTVGVMVLGTKIGKSELTRSFPVFKKLKDFIGSEINRKKLEGELEQLFEALPNIIGVSDFKGEIIKVNKAGSDLLEFDEDEMVGKSLFDFIHPDDHERSAEEMVKLSKGESVFKFENRYITKSGKILWLSWQSSSNLKDKIVYASATNITTEKKLKELLDRASKIAIIGGWEIDLTTNRLYWSDIVHQIHETDSEVYKPTLEEGIEFFRSDYQDLVTEKIQDAQIHGSSFDFEAPLITANGLEKWVRVIGQSEMARGKCVRFFGSFQDIDDKKRLEQKMNEILGSITDGFYALDDNWNFTYFNKEAERLLKKNRQDVLGEKIWDIFSSVKGTDLEINYRTVVSTQVAQSFEYLFPGDNSWYEINVYPSRDGIVSYFKNIDDKKQASEELKEAYLEKDQILESIGDGFFAVDNDWIVTYWNRAAEEILPTKRDEIVGKNLWEVYDDIIDTKFYRKYHKAKRTGKVIAFEELYATLNIWFEVTVYPSKIGLSIFFKDISERKKSELKIVQANERFEKVAQATSDAIWDWDIENDHFYRVKGFAELFGLKVKNILSKKEFWKDSFHSDDLSRIKESLENTLKDPNKDYWEIEYRIIQPSNEIKIVKDKGVIIRDKSGNAVRMVGAIADITETKRHEIELRNLNDQLRKHTVDLELTNEQLEQFAYIASHDLQEPLRMITSFLNQLQRKYADELDDKAQQYIHFATDGAKRMKQIILDLLEYSRAGRVDHKTEKINLNKLLDRYIALRKKVIKENNVTLKFDSLPEIVGQLTPLTQSIHSLIDNAIKYRKPNESPTVEVNVTEDEDSWLFCVKDDGIGIESRFFDKIFILFQRLHNRKEYGGTGIGLSVAKKNIESWGGEIWVESVPDEGSTFYFTLPKPS